MWDWGGPLWPPLGLSQGSMPTMGHWQRLGSRVGSVECQQGQLGPLLGCDCDCSLGHATFYEVLSLSWWSWKSYCLSSVSLSIIYNTLITIQYIAPYVSQNRLLLLASKDPAGDILKVKMGAFFLLVSFLALSKMTSTEQVLRTHFLCEQ